MSSTIGKLMVDMLIESANYIEDIMSFFNIFVKLNDFSTAKAFRVSPIVPQAHPVNVTSCAPIGI